MPDTTAGPVTFLFTDIEGSTRLWDEHPEAMRAALLQHDDLLRACIDSHGGRVFKTVGDAFCAAFPNPRGAVETVIASQQWMPALALRTPAGERPLKVRMALHSGVVEERDGDYFGQPLNRIARLLAIGHGSQVRLSLAAAELVRDNLPAGVSLADLGKHRLKDLGRPETVFQLHHPELPCPEGADFPPLRSLDNPELRHNLPRQVTIFIGREKELADVKALLERSRLVTLTGSGGCGKTRLALQVAADMLDGSGDGVWLVELAPLTDPSLVPQTVASVLGLKEEPGKSLTQTVVDYLKARHLLLLLDNCEHLLAGAHGVGGCARLVDAILRSCPRVLILATSREGLGIAGELTYRVPSLSLPDPKRDTTPESLSHFEAVRLFIERARLHQPQFAVTNQNAPALASICYRLDGIPLAIELAAARVRSLTIEDINSRLDQRFRLLTGGSRTALPRQQTLRSLIDWSYDLLNEAEKALLCRLSVFAGGWTLEAAEAVCGESMGVWVYGCMGEGAASPAPVHPYSHTPIHENEVLDLLTSLADKSLVVAETSGTSVRYRLLETVRQDARDRLLESGEGQQWRDRHLAHFTALGEEAEPHLVGAEQQVWLERLEAEHDNLRAAMEWSATSDAQAGLRLSGAVWRFWSVRGHFAEGRERIARLLTAAEPGRRTAERARALSGAGALAYRQGDYAAARVLYEEGPEIMRELGDRQGIAIALGNLADMAFDQEDWTAARAYKEDALSVCRELGWKWGMAGCLHTLARVALIEGDREEARRGCREALTLFHEIGERRAVLAVLEFACALTAAEEHPERAARLYGAVQALQEASSYQPEPPEEDERGRHAAAARAALDDDAAFDAAWAAGRAMTLEQAIAYALGDEEPS